MLYSHWYSSITLWNMQILVIKNTEHRFQANSLLQNVGSIKKCQCYFYFNLYINNLLKMDNKYRLETWTVFQFLCQLKKRCFNDLFNEDHIQNILSYKLSLSLTIVFFLNRFFFAFTWTTFNCTPPSQESGAVVFMIVWWLDL